MPKIKAKSKNKGNGKLDRTNDILKHRLILLTSGLELATLLKQKIFHRPLNRPLSLNISKL